MDEYRKYGFSVNEGDILTVLKDAVRAGVEPMLYINGMYYTVNIDAGPVQDSSDNDLPF